MVLVLRLPVPLEAGGLAEALPAKVTAVGFLLRVDGALVPLQVTQAQEVPPTVLAPVPRVVWLRLRLVGVFGDRSVRGCQTLIGVGDGRLLPELQALDLQQVGVLGGVAPPDVSVQVMCRREGVRAVGADL